MPWIALDDVIYACHHLLYDESVAGPVNLVAPESVRHWRVDQILTSDLFGLPSARPAALDGLIEERERLLAKERPSAKDTSRLAALRAEIGAHPAGESPTLLEAEELLLELTRAKTEAVKKNGSMGAKRKKA